MGLDIYFLERERPTVFDNENEKREFTEVGYLRKHNYVYAYFNERIDPDTCDCEVTREDLEDLVSSCEKVLEAHDEQVSRDLLPTTAGLFFGSTEYDKYYYMDIEEGLALFRELLEAYDDSKELIVYFWY